MISWTKNQEFRNVWYATEMFSGYQYNTIVQVVSTDTTVKYFISATSGKKRKDFNIFDDKENKSLGGMRALFWIKKAMLDFPSYYDAMQKRVYIVVQWTDKKRRDVYERLLKKDGFRFMHIDNEKCLVKML